MQQLSMFETHVYQPNPNEHKALLFNVTSFAEQKKFRELLIINTQVEVVDTYTLQLAELIKLQNPSKKYTKEELLFEVNKLINDKNTDLLGTWCYYSWSKKLVHLLNIDEFIAVRTNRNQLKITPQEQAKLQLQTIGIIGLSVGQSVALTLVMERVCGSLKLADFDELDLSNLNRLRTGVCNIGLKKTIIAAREIAEIDPYFNVEIFSEGVSAENMDNFFENLDLLVEVCDGLEIKINSRIKARALKLPVIMDTNDRGMIDIERFDLEPNRPLFHGLVNEATLTNINELNPNERLGLIMQIVSFNNTSDKLKLSMSEIGKTISTWPQLASSVMIGAGATVDCCRRILLNEKTPSGRFYIDTDELICETQIKLN